ncbi:MAG: hypothetical protein B9S34_03120 [Opitutia bacterium Tous-C1TDCM]|nr:MAG: hypothetical protein B9S34_03120 [Opitutae bacterium Tous-C1TDCM]
MIVIRRLTDRRRAYTGIFLPGEAPQIFPTSDHEHARIMQIYLQDRPYDGVENDFSDYGLNGIALKAVAFAPAPDAKKPAANSAAG